MDKKKLISLRVISLLVSVMAILFLFFIEIKDKDIIITSFTTWSVIVLYLILLGISAFEAWRLEDGKRYSIFRIVYLFIGLFVGCVNIGSGISMLSVVLMFASIPYTIIMLISVILTAKETTDKKKGEVKYTLPYMVLKRSEQTRNNVALAVFAVITIIIAVVLGITDVGLGPLMYIAPMLFVVIFATMMFLPKTSKKLIAASNDGEYSKFMEIYNSVQMDLQDPRSIAYVETLRANLLINIDPIEAEKIMRTVEPVKNVRNFQIAVLAMALSARGHYKEALQVCGDGSQLSKRLELNHIIFDTTREVEDIEFIFRINTKHRVSNLNSMYFLMVYFDKRGNISMAKEYAELIIKENSEFTRFNNYANNVLKK